MVWVNFLPWRSRRRQAQRLRTLLLSGLLLLLPAAVFVHAAGQQAANTQSQDILVRWQDANKQISNLKARTIALTAQRQALLQAIAARKRQQQQMLRWFKFARDLTRQMPETLWLSDMSKNADGLSLTGVSKGIREMHDFQQRLQSLALFQQVKTEKISLDEKGRIRFSLLAALQAEEEIND